MAFYGQGWFNIIDVIMVAIVTATKYICRLIVLAVKFYPPLSLLRYPEKAISNEES